MYRRAKIAFALIIGGASIYVFSPGAPKTAPAAAAARSTSMDGTTVVNCDVPTTLFNGAVPPNGFIVQSYGVEFFVNDNGAAKFVSPTSLNAGFVVPPSNGSAFQFATPPGYMPMGPVNVLCLSSSSSPPTLTMYVAARGW